MSATMSRGISTAVLGWLMAFGGGCTSSMTGPSPTARQDDSARIVLLAQSAYQHRRTSLGFATDTIVSIEKIAPTIASGGHLTWVQFLRGDTSYHGGSIAVVWGDSLARIIDTAFVRIQ
jgi:hypothetical protein